MARVWFVRRHGGQWIAPGGMPAAEHPLSALIFPLDLGTHRRVTDEAPVAAPELPAEPPSALRRVFVEVDDEGYPDGLCVDAEGGVWVALWEGGAVRRYDADGRLDRVVTIPTGRVTSCAFAGEEYRTLIVTTAAHGRARDPRAGLTYAHEPGDVVGLPVDRFAG